MNRLLVLICICLLTSCTTYNKDTRLNNNIYAEGDRIFINNDPYAEIVYIYGNASRCRGFAIHYLVSDTYEWVSPKGGIQLKDNNTEQIYSDIPTIISLWDKFQPNYKILKGYKSAGGDGYFKLDWRKDITISENGLLISYEETTEASILFGAKSRKYKIRYQ